MAVSHVLSSCVFGSCIRQLKSLGVLEAPGMWGWTSDKTAEYSCTQSPEKLPEVNPCSGSCRGHWFRLKCVWDVEEDKPVTDLWGPSAERRRQRLGKLYRQNGDVELNTPPLGKQVQLLSTMLFWISPTWAPWQISKDGQGPQPHLITSRCWPRLPLCWELGRRVLSQFSDRFPRFLQIV